MDGGESKPGLDPCSKNVCMAEKTNVIPQNKRHIRFTTHVYNRSKNKHYGFIRAEISHACYCF